MKKEKVLKNFDLFIEYAENLAAAYPTMKSTEVIAVVKKLRENVSEIEEAQQEIKEAEQTSNNSDYAKSICKNYGICEKTKLCSKDGYTCFE